MKKRLAVCLNDDPTFLFAPMFITKGKTYEVIPCPNSGTVQVVEPDEGIQLSPEGDLVPVRTKPIRYLRDRFRMID